MTRKLYAAAALAVALTLGAACAPSADDDTGPAAADAADGNTDAGDVSTGLGSQDASADVVVESYTPPAGFNPGTVTLAVTNHSSKPSDYYVELNVLDANGVVLGFTNALAQRVPADGGQARLTAMVVEDGAASVVITEVQRTASI